jgi:uncharacterized protein YcaQ
LDAKAHRKEGVFEVRSVHLEQGVEVCDELLSDVAAAIRECAVWHKTPEVAMRQSGQPCVVKRLMNELPLINPQLITSITNRSKR